MRKLNSLQRSLNTLDHSHTHAHEHLRGRKWKAKKTRKKINLHRNEYTQRHRDTQTQTKHWEIEMRGEMKTERDQDETKHNFFCLSFRTVMIYYDRVLFRMEKTHFGMKKRCVFLLLDYLLVFQCK